MQAPSPWLAIDALVHDLGALSAQVQVAERTLASDPRTRAARESLDRATEAVRLAIDGASDSAAAGARSALGETRALTTDLGLTAAVSGNLVRAARKLIAASQAMDEGTTALRERLQRRRGRS